MMVGSGVAPAAVPPVVPVAPPMLPVLPATMTSGVSPQIGSAVTVGSQMSPAPESPEKAARRAAENEAIAERAIENSVHKAQDQERAAMYAAKKASALRAAAE